MARTICLNSPGIDLIADAMPAVLEENPKAQLICVGPVIDLYGKFAALKLEVLMKKYPGRVFSKPEFTVLPPFIFSGAEFALIPSRDEPFGLVAVEFGRKGALGIGARVGGLGQMVSHPLIFASSLPLLTSNSPVGGSQSKRQLPLISSTNLSEPSKRHSHPIKKQELICAPEVVSSVFQLPNGSKICRNFRTLPFRFMRKKPHARSASNLDLDLGRR